MDAATTTALSYALVTPARNEAENLRRVAACLTAQTVQPVEWIIVENGSTDETSAVAEDLARRHGWIRVLTIPERGGTVRGGAIVRAFAAGVEALARPPDVAVNLDADISVEPEYFERLLAGFASDPELGIASGSGYELENGSWRQRFQTRSCVWGASRAYRWECLREVWPLDERYGWDGIDELRANVRGWRTETLLDLPFLHHRREGERDGARRVVWAAEGRLAHYMGYRLGYLLARTLYRTIRDRDPAALAMLWSYASAAVRHESRLADVEARAYLRRVQRLRSLPLRAREALGKRT